MGDIIIGKKVQTSQRYNYRPGLEVCLCFYCSIGTETRQCHRTGSVLDWQLGFESCCGSMCSQQPICVKPDAGDCYIGKSSKNIDPFVSVQWDGAAPNIKCSYNISHIDTKEQVQHFEDMFGLNDSLRIQYCTQQVANTCPFGMSTNKCSRLKSTDDTGSFCRLWFEEQSPAVKSATIQDYCLVNDTDDCRCVNRYKNPEYKKIKKSSPYNDGCWFDPCADKDGIYLVTPDLINPTCPTQICQQIFDIANANNVNVDNIKNDISCFNSDVLRPVEKNTFLKKYQKLIMAILVIIIFILIFK
jgi:hypothetical protein